MERELARRCGTRGEDRVVHFQAREGKKVKEKSKEAENEGKFTAHGASGFEMDVCSKYMRRRAGNMCILVTALNSYVF